MIEPKKSSKNRQTGNSRKRKNWKKKESNRPDLTFFSLLILFPIDNRFISTLDRIFQMPQSHIEQMQEWMIFRIEKF